MAEQTVGFVGGGRVARIILGGFKKAGCMLRFINMKGLIQ
jgi:pyrroline-5-carboxylate reductase